MKKYLFFALLFGALVLPAWACGPCMPDYDAYVFRLCPNQLAYSRNNDMRLAEAWSQLIGGRVTVAQSRQLASVGLDALDTLDNPIVRFARGSKEVGDYLRLLVEYLDATQVVSDPWDYPSEEELSRYQTRLSRLLSATQRYKGSLLRERYYLLRMRILFRQGNYEAILSQWESSPLTSKSVFADMARDYYAGALFHSGRQEDAAVQYALSGNMFDAHQCMRDLHGAECLRRVVEVDPNSPVLYYMLEEFVNGCAESMRYYACLDRIRPLYQLGVCLPWERLYEWHVPYNCYDYESCPDGRTRIARLPSINDWFQQVRAYQVQSKELALVEEVVGRQIDNPAVTDRAMWLSARAYLCYLQKRYDEAWSSILQAVDAPGSEASRENAHYLLMLLSTRQSDLALMERTLLKGLPDLMTQRDEEEGLYVSADGSYRYDDTYYYGSTVVGRDECLNHLVARGIVERYLNEGDSLSAMLAWGLLLPDYLRELYEAHFARLGEEHYTAFCALSLPLQEQMVEWKRHPEKIANAWTRYMVERMPFSTYDYLDAICTGLMRDGKFAQAIPYLEQLPLSFLSRQPIAAYAANRSIHSLPWERTYVDEEALSDQVTLTNNAKLDFCREVIKWQNRVTYSSGEERLEACYRLGALYHQASVKGSCWWLTQYGVSNEPSLNLSLVEGHYDFVEHSRNLLIQSLSSANRELRYRAYYLLLTQSQGDLLVYRWDDKDFNLKPMLNSQSPYYPVLRLFREDLYGRPGEPYYVSHCDLLVQMYKMPLMK